MIRKIVNKISPVNGVKVKLEFKQANLDILPINKIQYVKFYLNNKKGVFESVVEDACHVLKGDTIALSSENPDRKIIASVSGKVKIYKDHIRIYTDNFIFNECLYREKHLELISSLSKNNVIEKLKEHNIQGLGGALFPSHIKISNEHIQHVIINAVECEPSVNCDQALLNNYLKETLAGALILKKATNSRDIYLTVKKTNHKVINDLKELQKEHPEFKNIKLATVPDVYPAGAAKEIIRHIFGVNLHRSEISATKGFLVQNAMTCWSVFRSIVYDVYQTERIISIFGEDIDNPKNILVPEGTILKDIYSFLNIKPEDVRSVKIGGFMMGESVLEGPQEQYPVMKNANSIILNLDTKPKTEYNCINCAKCVNACPVGLLPNRMLFKIKNYDDFSDDLIADIKTCIKCNACNYVCPSNINLTKHFKDTLEKQKQIDLSSSHNQYLCSLVNIKKQRLEKEKSELKIRKLKK